MAKYRFEQIAINSKEKKKPAEEDRFTYIGLEHLDTGSLNVTRLGSDVAPIGEKLVMRKGDVLFGKRRAYQKKVAIAPFDGIFSAHGMVLRPQEKVVDRKFFPLFISSDYFLDAAIKISVGSLSPTINWRDLKDLEFELPDLDTQKELAEVLWAINDTIESYKKLISVTDELVKSQFIEMFGDPLKNPRHLPQFRLEKFIHFLTSGSRGWAKYYSEDGEWFITITNVKNCKVITKEIADHGAYINQHLTCIRLEQSALDPTYVAYFMETEAGKKQFFEKNLSSVKAGLNFDSIRSLRLLVPPLEPQKEFVNFLQQSDKSKFAVLNCLKRNLLLILQKTEDVHSLINQSAKKYFCKSCHRENHNG